MGYSEWKKPGFKGTCSDSTLSERWKRQNHVEQERGRRWLWRGTLVAHDVGDVTGYKRDEGHWKCLYLDSGDEYMSACIYPT